MPWLQRKISKQTLVVFNVYNSKQALPSGKTHKVVNPPNTEKGFRFSPSHSPQKVSIIDKTKKSQAFYFYFLSESLAFKFPSSDLGEPVSPPGD